MKIDCLHWITSIVPVLLKAPHHPFFPPLLNVCNCRSRGIFCKYNGRKYNVCKGQISWANAHSLEADLVKRPDAYHFLCTIKNLVMWKKAVCYSLSQGLTDLCSPVSQYITNPIKLGLMKRTCKNSQNWEFQADNWISSYPKTWSQYRSSWVWWEGISSCSRELQHPPPFVSLILLDAIVRWRRALTVNSWSTTTTKSKT